jgi:uncharacterized protein (DUF2141 family)
MKRASSGLVLVSGGHVLSPESFGPPPVRLMVRNAEPGWRGGALTVLVWASAEGFPWNAKKARRIARLDPHAGEGSVVFMGLAPGHYAVTAFEDPAGTRRLAKDLLGRPKHAVFMPAGAGLPKKAAFGNHAFHLKQSTIIELKLARAQAGAQRYRAGNIHDDRSEEPQYHAADAGAASQPAEASHRR